MTAAFIPNARAVLALQQIATGVCITVSVLTTVLSVRWLFYLLVDMSNIVNIEKWKIRKMYFFHSKLINSLKMLKIRIIITLTVNLLNYLRKLQACLSNSYLNWDSEILLFPKTQNNLIPTNLSNTPILQ